MKPYGGGKKKKKHNPSGRNVENCRSVSSQRNVSSGQRDAWDDGLVGNCMFFEMNICSQQELPEQSISCRVWVYIQRRQQLGRLTAPLHYNPCIYKDKWGERMRMHTSYISLRCDPVCRNVDIQSESMYCTLLIKKGYTEQLGMNSLIWPQWGWNQPNVCLVVEVHVKVASPAVIFYASLWVAVTLPSLNEEHQFGAGMMQLSRGIFAGTELLASLHNPQRHTLNLHFNEIFSCH